MSSFPADMNPHADDGADSHQGFKTFQQERIEWERRNNSDGQPEGARRQDYRVQDPAVGDVPESEEELAAEQGSQEDLADEDDTSGQAIETTERLSFSRAPAREPPKSGYARWREDRQTLVVIFAGILSVGLIASLLLHVDPWTALKGLFGRSPYGWFCAIGWLQYYVYKMSAARLLPKVDRHGIALYKATRFEEQLIETVRWQDLRRIEYRKSAIFPRAYSCIVLHTGRKKISIKWRDFLTAVNPAELVNAIRTWASSASIDPALPVFRTSERGGPAYTELWLQSLSLSTPSAVRSDQLAAGSLVGDGRYRIVGRISAGGQGTTYLAEPTDTGCRRLPPDASEAGLGAPTDLAAPESKEVAIKEYILPTRHGSSGFKQVAGLTHEAAVLKRIDHRQIVKMLDWFLEGNRGYMVLEYVEGTTLEDLVARQGPQPESLVRRLAMQLCDIAGYLHVGLQVPIIHRDITPHNLILQPDGNLKLIDFNVAQDMLSTAHAPVVGKASYIAPEQFRGRAAPESDIYSIGCTLFYLLTGLEPEPLTVSHPRHVRSDVSIALDQIVAGCTQLERAERLRSAGAIKEMLAQLEAGQQPA